MFPLFNHYALPKKKKKCDVSQKYALLRILRISFPFNEAVSSEYASHAPLNFPLTFLYDFTRKAYPPRNGDFIQYIKKRRFRATDGARPFYDFLDPFTADTYTAYAYM